MCTIKDLKMFLGSKDMTVGETRSLIYKLLDNLDTYRDESQKILIQDRNNYKPIIPGYNTQQKMMVNRNLKPYN
jgi:hypothetical protein